MVLQMFKKIVTISNSFFVWFLLLYSQKGKVMISRISVNNNNNYPTLNNFQNVANLHHPKFEGNSYSTLSKKQKAVILLSSMAGMAPVLAFWAKGKGFSLNPSKILKTPVKDWALFKYAPEGKYIKFEEPQIISVASSSVLGGFVGGALVDDKSNVKAKKREILNQILGNVIVPVLCVGMGARIFGKYAQKLENMMPTINKSGNVFKTLNMCLKKLPNTLSTIAFLSIGIFAGNRVSNFINEKLYHKKVDRSIKVTDFAPHVDDVCMALSMMNKESSFGAKLGRVIPLALLVPGYQTGIAQDN